MKLSLGAILAIYLAGLQFLAVLSVVLSSYVTSERVLLEHARALLSDLGHNAIEHSKGFLEPARGTAELAKRLAENNIVASDNPEVLEKLLFQQLQVAPQFSGVLYGDEFGNFVYVMRSEGPAQYRTKIVSTTDQKRSIELIWRDNDYRVVERRFDPEDQYDPRTRPWYVSAKATNDDIWTDPYIFFSSKRPGITAASPVVQFNDELRGVIGVDIEIEAISEFLSNLKIGDNGAAMILNGNGEVIAHPNPELIKVENDDGSLGFAHIGEITDPIAKAAFGSLTTSDISNLNTEEQSEFNFEGESYVTTLIPALSQDLPWTIAIYAPEDDFIGGIKANRTRNIWIAVVIAAITGLIGLKIANYINKPVRDFAVRAEMASLGQATRPATYPELEGARETLIHEITRRKTFEREFGQTFDMAAHGMAQISHKTGHFIRVNSHLEDILGYSSEELLGMTFADILHPDDTDTYSSFQDAVNEGFEYNQEKRYVHKDGSIIWLQVNAILIRSAQGDPLHTVVTVNDVTARRESEEEIYNLNRDLSHFSRINMMGQMATGLAHELNQPLTAITQNADAALLTVSQSQDPDPELIEILTELDTQAHRGADIIRALRGFVRKDEGNKSSFDFNELLDQALHLVHPEASKNSVSITVKTSKIPPVVGNRIQVAQVVVNLLRNSIEAIASANKRSKKVKISAKTIDDQVQICIQDTGGGVDPAIDLFTRFETSKRDGMGLGLSFSRTIIEENGGKLWYDAKIKDGSKFFFTLPSSPKNQEAQKNV
jgi:PAS domain S-box-containing protein